MNGGACGHTPGRERENRICNGLEEVWSGGPQTTGWGQGEEMLRAEAEGPRPRRELVEGCGEKIGLEGH